MKVSHLTGVDVRRGFQSGQSDVICMKAPVHVGLVSHTPVETVQLFVVVKEDRCLLELLAVSPAQQLPDISHQLAS